MTQHLIAILDDETDRISAMLACLTSYEITHPTVAFDNAPDMIGWLDQNLESLQLLCLDHDLGPNRIRDGETFDPGIGRDVIDYLATRKPTCPVIIHTTNALAAPGMQRELEEAGWPFYRVIPYSDLQWVAEVWIDAVKQVLAAKSLPR